MVVMICNPNDAELVSHTLQALGLETVAVSPRATVTPGTVHRIDGSLETLAPVLRALR